MITRESVRRFFRDMRAKDVDLRREMLWGYFFVDRRRTVLATLRKVLVKDGYRFVDVFDGQDGDLYLHVERVERHSAASLHERCVELSVLGAKHRGVTFDGFDLGNVDGSVLHR